MDWVQAVSIIGAVAGLSSAFGIVLTYVTKLSKMETKIDLIWSVFVEDALRAQVKAGILSHSSAYSLSNVPVMKSHKYKNLIPPELLQKIKDKNTSNDYQLAEEYVKCVGFDDISRQSNERGMSTQEYLAICIGFIHSKTTHRVIDSSKVNN